MKMTKIRNFYTYPLTFSLLFFRDSGDLLETSIASGSQSGIFKFRKKLILDAPYSSDNLDGGASSQVKKSDKRYPIAMEMLETEQNYLRLLIFLVEVKLMPKLFSTQLLGIEKAARKSLGNTG